MEPFRVHILGCGSALPTLRHFPSIQVVECRGKIFMVDCGEGAQLQMRRAGLSFDKLGHIFISHLHGDHCFGLIGFISTAGLLGRTAPLYIHAPAELQPMLKAQLDMFFNYDIGYAVEFLPVDTTRHQVIFEDRSLQVETIPLSHRMPCCGFLFREKPGLPHIRRELIDMYGIPVSQINNIKAGQGYTLPDGTEIAHERLVRPADKPRSYAYCSDTRYMSHLHELLSGVDTLYHEATYTDELSDLAEARHHSTTLQAARCALEAGAKRLVIGHYSSRQKNIALYEAECRSVFPETYAASDLDTFDVPLVKY